jgi:membrane associated rhomboid family serine protease
VNARGQLARLARKARRWPWLALLASLAGLLASVLPAERWLAFTATGMQRGQLWRFWSGHFVHYGSAHLWGDWLAFVVWAGLVESESRRALAATLLLGAPLLLFALELSCPELGEYRGLSGIDTALVIELILLRGFGRSESDGERGPGARLTRLLGRRALRVVGGCSLGLLGLKIGYEFCAGQAILAHDLGAGVRLLPAAHAFGALIGAGIGLIFGRPKQPRFDWGLRLS